MKRRFPLFLILTALVPGLFSGCTGGDNPASNPGANRPKASANPGHGNSLQRPTAGAEIVLYSGRSKVLVDPVIRQFMRERGITVKAGYGNTGEMAARLQEEGERTPADLFWAQDAGALSFISKAGLFDPLPEQILEMAPEQFRSSAGAWVGVSGRARVLAYSSARVDPQDLPSSILELTDPKWKGRVGWAPANGSFQAFVTAMRISLGEAAAREWLEGMRRNAARAYPSNSPILQAIAAGQIDVGLVNHYYLPQLKRADPNFPVEQVFFRDGDVGNFVNVSGIGVLKTSRRKEAALEFVEFLLSPQAQQYLTSEAFEYPATVRVIPHPQLIDLEELLNKAPTGGSREWEDLEDLEGTLKLLREARVL